MAKSHYGFCLLLVFAVIVLETQGSSLRTIQNAYASRCDKVPIYRDANGLYAEVDYREYPTSLSDAGKFLLSFIHHQTIFASNNCLGFNSYNCSKHNCQITSSRQDDFVDMYFTAKTKKANIEAYLDHPLWSSRTNAYLTESCSSEYNNTIGSGRIGIIGLSNDQGSETNFKVVGSDGLIFSLYLKKDLSGGILAFSKDGSLISFSAAPVVIQVTDGSTWRTAPASCGLSFPNKRISFQASLMIDLHSNVIALPLSFYDQIIEGFKAYGVICPVDQKYKPECSCLGKVSALPTLILEVQGKEIAIPPSLYLKDLPSGQSSIILNFKAVDPAFTGINYIHQDFKDTIILDSHFLSHYYTVFYKDRIEFYGQGLNSRTWVVIGTCVATFFIVTIGVYINRRKKRAPEQPYSRASSFVESTSASKQTLNLSRNSNSSSSQEYVPPKQRL